MMPRTTSGVLVIILLVMALGWLGQIGGGVSAQSDPTPAADLDDGLELARNFAGNNTDWKPVIQEFDGVTMVLVPAGCFDMGGTLYDDERPVHKICFDNPFWIDKYEVGNGQFAAFEGQAARASYFSGEDRPREQITWSEARDFCASRGARLPTEAEWEYAARGPDGLEYPWGAVFDWRKVVGNRSSGEGTALIGSIPAGQSWVGAYDLSGNVWEWTSSLYQSYDANEVREQDIDDRTDVLRVLRGGSWRSRNTHLFRAAVRLNWDPRYGNASWGFRCARSS